VTPAVPAVVLDWTRAAIGPMEPCVLCGQPAMCRSPRTGKPCHKTCAQNWITTHARDAAELARLIVTFTPRRH
jgi:hypothetical protein